MIYVGKRCLDVITPLGFGNLAKPSPISIKIALTLGSSGPV